MRILIIGGTRFIGPWVVRRLAKLGHEVTVFHRGETRAELPGGVNEIYGDRCALASFAAEFKTAAPDVVLDMIAFTEEDARTLIGVFKGIARRAVVLSSADVYGAYGRLRRLETGEPAALPLAEDAPLRESLYPYRAQASGPDDFKYHYEKILVERVVMNESELAGTVLRLPAVYGPGDQQHRLFGYVKRMDDKRPFILLGEAQARWRWTRGYVENVADAIALAAADERAADNIYNVGEREALTEADWVRSIGRAAGWNGEVLTVPADSLPEHLAAKVDYAHHLFTDTSRLRAELGYNERVSLAEALRRTIDWERANPPAEIFPAEIEYAAEDAALARLKQ
ncbi:MAG TPA: NAD-dependent epimerase/dehydratase family protein [Pyrinomonadaceae bacterium]|nr:NAD-dependent epimerase/dehydratase family protein [Pyrinomonadaceae bacterium]